MNRTAKFSIMLLLALMAAANARGEMGAGAITKWLFPRERRIERAPNVRNIEQYIARVDEMVERKRALIDG